MNVRALLQKVSSVTTAAVALLGGSTAFAGAEAELRDMVKKGKSPDDASIEPLVLRPAEAPCDPMLFARGGHSSHSSHASHSSHSSGTSGRIMPPRGDYTPYYPAPAPSAPSATPRPTYYAPSRVIPAQTPVPVATPAPLDPNLLRIEFKNGLVLFGTLIAKSADGICFQTSDNKKYKFKRDLLTDTTIVGLALPPK